MSDTPDLDQILTDAKVLTRDNGVNGTVVYGLIDPAEPSRVRYVGCTSNHVKRMRDHCSPKGEKPTSAWIGELRASGREPAMILLRAHNGYEVWRYEWEITRAFQDVGMADLSHRTDSYFGCVEDYWRGRGPFANKVPQWQPGRENATA